MAIRIAINGLGRIGRSVLRALHERGELSRYQIVWLNEPAPTKAIAHLLKFDSTHGRFPGTVSFNEETLMIDDQAIEVHHASDLSSLSLDGVDVLIECSGHYTADQLHRLVARDQDTVVLISNPSQASVDDTIIFGLNHQVLSKVKRGVYSCGSCTSNAVVPIISEVKERYSIISGATLTLHSAMNDQPVIDAYHDDDLRLTRSAMQSMIPVETALDKGIARLIPELEGKLVSHSIRVPTTNVSAIDLTLELGHEVTTEEFDSMLKDIASRYAVINLSSEPLASCDFIHDSSSAVIDRSLSTLISPTFIKIYLWFDNEWGYANRLIDCVSYLSNSSNGDI